MLLSVYGGVSLFLLLYWVVVGGDGYVVSLFVRPHFLHLYSTATMSPLKFRNMCSIVQSCSPSLHGGGTSITGIRASMCSVCSNCSTCSRCSLGFLVGVGFSAGFGSFIGSVMGSLTSIAHMWFLSCLSSIMLMVISFMLVSSSSRLIIITGKYLRIPLL